MKTLDELIRALAKKGELSHLSLAFSGRGVFTVAYRGASEGHYCHTEAADPVTALVNAMTDKPGVSKRKKPSTGEPDFG